MKKKNYLFIILILVLLMGFVFNTKFVRADSGWDYDYDSGSSWDSDYGSSSSSDSSSGSEDSFMYVVIFVVLIIIYVFNFISLKKIDKSTKKYEDMSEEEVKNKLKISSKEFKKLAFNIYKDIQNAWSEFDYDTLRRNTTNELYNTYKMQLETLSLKKQKNVMNEIELLDVKISQIQELTNSINVTVYMNIKMFDYVVDTENKVVRGTDKNKVNIEYEIVFVKKLNTKNKCPNCGSKLVNSSDKCDYCGSKLVVGSKKYVMSKKICIQQRTE